MLLYSSHRPISGHLNIEEIQSYIEQEEIKQTLLTLPNGSSKQIPLRFQNGEYLANWDDTSQPGLYTIKTGNLAARHFSVNLNYGESDLSPLSRKDIKTIKSFLPIHFTKNYNTLINRANEEEGVKEWWRYFIYIAMILILAELFIAWRFSK